MPGRSGRSSRSTCWRADLRGRDPEHPEQPTISSGNFWRYRKIALAALAITIASFLAFGLSGLHDLNVWQQQQLPGLRIGTWFTLWAQAFQTRMAIELNRFARQESPNSDALIEQFEIFWSRVNVLDSEEGAASFIGTEAVGTFVATTNRDMEEMEPLIEDLEPGEQDRVERLQVLADRIGWRLTDLSLIINRDRVAALQQTDTKSLALFRRFLMSMLVVCLSTLVMIVMLIHAMLMQRQHLQRSKQSEDRAAIAERNLRT